MSAGGLTWESWMPEAPSASGAGAAGGGIGIHVQGAPLGDILYMVRSEIEKVRKNQDLAPLIAELKTSIAAEKSAREKAQEAMQRYVDAKFANLDYLDRIAQMNDKIGMLETQVKDAVKLYAARMQEISALNSRINELERENSESVHALEGRLADLSGSVDTSLQTVARQCQDIVETQSDVTARLRQVEDSTFALSSQQGKVQGEVAKQTASLEATNTNLDNLENLVDRHTEDIKTLLKQKKDTIPEGYMFPMAQPPSAAPQAPPPVVAAPAPVVAAAPVSSATVTDVSTGTTSKVNLGGIPAPRQEVIVKEFVLPPHVAVKDDIEKMYNLVDELEHQLKLLSVACTEGLVGVSKKTDKKIEFMTNWIVKYVKNVKEGVPKDTETDIGKIQMGVKCLVCNQPAKQNEIDAATSHPAFKNTFQPRKEGGKQQVSAQGSVTDEAGGRSQLQQAGSPGGSHIRSRSPTDGIGELVLPRVTSANNSLLVEEDFARGIKTSQDSPVRTSDKATERFLADRYVLFIIYIHAYFGLYVNVELILRC